MMILNSCSCTKYIKQQQQHNAHIPTLLKSLPLNHPPLLYSLITHNNIYNNLSLHVFLVNIVQLFVDQFLWLVYSLFTYFFMCLFF